MDLGHHTDDHELLDIFDGNFLHIGTAARSIVHQRGLWHKSIHVWVVIRRGLDLDLVLQRRSTNVGTNPGKIDVAVAGHLRAGESPREGLREVAEELGIPGWDAIEIARRFDISDSPTSVNRELAHVHVLEVEHGIERMTPDSYEVDAVLQLPLHDFIALARGDLNRQNATLRQPGDWSHPRTVRVSMDDFVPRRDSYWLDVASLCAARITTGHARPTTGSRGRSTPAS